MPRNDINIQPAVRETAMSDARWADIPLDARESYRERARRIGGLLLRNRGTDRIVVTRERPSFDSGMGCTVRYPARSWEVIFDAS